MMRPMKDSGIEWIGKIPEGWGEVMLSSLFCEHKQKNEGMQCNNLLSLSYGKIIRKSIDTSEGLLPGSFEGYNIIDKGDIVLRLTDLQNDHKSLRTGLATERGIITSAYVTIRLDVNEIASSKYMHYFLHSFDVAKGFYGMGDGVRQSLPFEGCKKITLLLPPLAEQQAIADYLDEKCAAIDKLIDNQKVQIEKMKEYKQSVITEAVTKGLNPSVPMKDSGIEWIGKIPEEWGEVMLSSLFCEHKQKNEGMQCNNLLSLSYGKIIRKSIDTSEGLLPGSFEGYNIIDKGDIVLRLTDLQNDHKSLRTGLATERGIITSAYVTIRLDVNEIASSKYMHYFLHSFDVAKGFYGMGDGVRQSLPFEGCKKITLLLPPLAEQQAIADYLDEKCAAIDKLIAVKQAKIDKLNDYKKSLIYEYVTGKREVL